MGAEGGGQHSQGLGSSFPGSTGRWQNPELGEGNSDVGKRQVWGGRVGKSRQEPQF